MSKKSRILRSLYNHKNDPNYIPRVTISTYDKVIIKEDGTGQGVKRTKTRFNIPLTDLPPNTAGEMGRLAHQVIVGLPNPNNISNRKNPRVVNNSPKYKKRLRSNGRTTVQRIRPVSHYILTKEAVQLLKLGDRKAILNDQGLISIHYKKHIVKGTKQILDRNFGFKPIMREKLEHNRL